MSKYTEVTISTTHEGSELVADILNDYTDLGVSINDVQDAIDLEKDGKYWDYADDSIYTSNKDVTIKASFEEEKAKKIIEEIKKRLTLLKKNSDFNLGELTLTEKLTDGDLWREKWKENFKPIHFNKLVVVPEWIKYPKKENEEIVLLDSNMAFGTGEHETTSMCIEYLCKYVSQNDTVLDVGCGSGILGICASKLGAKNVIMTDIDECAVEATKHNIELNKVNSATVLLKNLLDDNTVKGDIIVCNIMAEVLISFSPFLANNLNNNGIVILSGILSDRLNKVEDAYVKAGYNFVEHKIKGEWAACVFKKNN